VVGKLLQSLSTLSLLSDTRRKRLVLGAHRIIETDLVGARSGHRGLIVGRRPDDPSTTVHANEPEPYGHPDKRRIDGSDAR